MKAAATLVVVLELLTYCGAQMGIEYANLQEAPSVSGTLVGGWGTLDPNEQPPPEPIEGAGVCEMSNDWKVELKCTTTDKQGRWFFPDLPVSKIHYIKFRAGGWSPLYIRLKVKHKAKPLVVETAPGT